jgi:hypothetical protein
LTAAEKGASALKLLAQLCDQFNFDAGAEWDLRNAEGASSVLAAFSENITEKF